ncbi:hypothetical protein CLV82_2744 [Zeaxanthinibacter enoshimensis]|uniref:Uncharacterized protein n=1 Tax=Zeaxanthinibacter enoshimensis TaxID=392009 RepID=A0A4R6TJ95_9FLAO|nr:hypothetical protein CLV82_2744 [Zeaxanthinibacter enoshimensis]
MEFRVSGFNFKTNFKNPYKISFRTFVYLNIK